MPLHSRETFPSFSPLLRPSVYCYLFRAKKGLWFRVPRRTKPFVYRATRKSRTNVQRKFPQPMSQSDRKSSAVYVTGYDGRRLPWTFGKRDDDMLLGMRPRGKYVRQTASEISLSPFHLWGNEGIQSFLLCSTPARRTDAPREFMGTKNRAQILE